MQFISLWERRDRANFLEGCRGLTFGLAHQLREHGEFASSSKRHRDRVGSRLTNCKLLHIPLFLMRLSLRSVVLQFGHYRLRSGKNLTETIVYRYERQGPDPRKGLQLRGGRSNGRAVYFGGEDCF